MRLGGKIAIVVGAGQSPGEGIGNGRATVIRFIQEGAKVLAVDRSLKAAEETAELARQAAAIVLRHYHGYTNRAIAQALGIPERTVASRLAIAKQRLRGMLSQTYGVPQDEPATARPGFAVAD